MSGELLGTYDFNDVSLLIGPHKIKGFEEGTEITVERDEDTFTKKSGVDGNVTRSKSNNSMGFIEFVLNHLSKSNAFLEAQAFLDEKTGVGVLPTSLLDKSGKEKILGTESWIVRPSNKSYGGESGPRTWRIDMANLTFANTNF